MTYDIKEICRDLGVVPKTCYRWIKEGLSIVPESNNPVLILGSDLKEFIREKRKAKKVRLGRNQFYCLKCREAVFAKRGTLKVFSDRRTANCRACNGLLNRLC
jgi:transposase-like protein